MIRKPIAVVVVAAACSCRSTRSTDPTAPAGPAPQNVVATTIAYDRVLVHWDEPPSGSAKEYVVFRNGAEIVRTPQREIVDAGVPAASAAPLRYEVEATFGAGAGARSASVDASRDLPADGVPEPILAEHPQWVDLYHAAWRIAWGKIGYPTPRNGFVSPYMDEAFNPHTFQWDTCFMVLFGRYASGVFPGIHSLDNFYAKQHADGFVCREIVEDDGSDFFPADSDQSINPPLFAWIEWESYRFTGDKERLKAVLPHLVSYFRWIQDHRRRANGFYWTSNLGSGMDNSPREPDGWLDLTSQQALAALSIAKIAEQVGDATLSETFRYEYRLLKDLVNEKAWDPDDQIYYDLAADGSRTKVKTAASFWPLLAQIPSLTQAAGLVYHLNDPKEFRRPHFFPSLSADDPRYDPRGGYWRGAVWPPTWFAIVEGLDAYGLSDFAFEAVVNHLDNLAEVFRANGTIYENYSAERPAAGDPSRGDFVGWSGVGPIAGLVENVIGVQVSAPRNLVHWRIRLTEEHGVRHLRFGENDVSLLCEKRVAGGPCHLVVETDKPITLIVDPGFGPHLVDIPAGGAKFTLKNPALPESE
jgi:mannosylglycerate hydrolase MGH1-like protein